MAKCWSQAGAAPLVVLVNLALCSVPTAAEQCLTVGPVFRQSDRSQAEHLENPENQHSMHTSPPANIYILSLCLSVLWSYLGLCLFILPHLESLPFHCLSLLPPSFSPGPPSTLLSLILLCFSLCLSLSLLLRFNKSPGGRREKTGGCKNIYGFIYKGPRYCLALNPGEMIYFPPMCGTDPWGVTQQWTGFVLAIYGGCRGS